MDWHLIGLGVSALSAFGRYRFPSVSKPLASAAMAAGLALLVLAAFPHANPVFVGCAIAVFAILAGFFDWLYHRKQTKHSSAVRNLQAVSNKELRSEVERVARRLRLMETAFRQGRDEIIFNRNHDAIISHSRKQQGEWQTLLMPDAVALWSEIRTRLYGAPIAPEGEHEHQVALRYGMLAGIAPLNDAALELERLARLLPD